jgi:hypothetical protein
VSISYIGTEQKNEIDPGLVAELELACFNVKLGAERSHGYFSLQGTRILDSGAQFNSRAFLWEDDSFGSFDGAM